MNRRNLLKSGIGFLGGVVGLDFWKAKEFKSKIPEYFSQVIQTAKIGKFYEVVVAKKYERFDKNICCAAISECEILTFSNGEPCWKQITNVCPGDYVLHNSRGIITSFSQKG